MQAESFHVPFDPVGVAERTPSLGGFTNGVEFTFRQRFIHALDPIRSSRDWPGRQQRRERFRRLQPAPERTPPPSFCALHEFGTQSVSFHVPTDREEMAAILDGKTLETPLINVSLTGSMRVCVIPHRVRRRHPAKRLTHGSILIRTKGKMPVVRHRLIGVDLEIEFGKSLAQDSLERRVVFFLPEDLCSRVPRFKA